MQYKHFSNFDRDIFSVSRRCCIWNGSDVERSRRKSINVVGLLGITLCARRTACLLFYVGYGSYAALGLVPPPKNGIKSTYFSRWRSRDLNLSFMSFDVCSVLILHQRVKVKSEVETNLRTTQWEQRLVVWLGRLTERKNNQRTTDGHKCINVIFSPCCCGSAVTQHCCSFGSTRELREPTQPCITARSPALVSQNVTTPVTESAATAESFQRRGRSRLEGAAYCHR